MKLTNASIKLLSLNKKHSDGRGLYLILTSRHHGHWSYRFMLKGKSHEMGLGSYPSVSLLAARQMRDQFWALKSQGENPLFEKRKHEQEKQKNQNIYFRDVVEKFIHFKKPQWTCPKSERDWRTSLKRYAYPVLNKKPFSMINQKDIQDVLDPIWNTKKELPKKLQGRLNLIMGFAIQRGLYKKLNPATWKGNLQFAYFMTRHPSSIVHYRSLHYSKLPSLFKSLQEHDFISSLALQFLILTVARTKEVRLCTLEEIDLNMCLWKIPAVRMKARREHIVPLSKEAITLIKRLSSMHNYRYLFFGRKPNHPLSDMAMLTMVKRKFPNFDTTVHGLRSTFRDWAAEKTNYDHHIVEFALSHKLDSRTQGAYFRSDLRDKRKVLMQDWADYVVSNTKKSA